MAELNLVFSERSQVDFVELGMAAIRVLSDDEGKATDRASDVAEQWRHILVDEFQDTSRSQYELLTLLAEGWESAGRGTFFLVGDPMQSIYLFRQAEVELFERTRRLGLGEETAALHLAPLRLQTNFRSHAGLVDRLNELFKQVFGEAPSEAGHTYHVAFSESSASRPRPPNSVGVRVWPFLLPPKASPDQKLAMQDAQASRVVQIVQQHWPEIQAKQKEQGEFRVAVLVRAKAHLALITRKLREAGIPFRAVEIEQLGDRQEVKDVTALARALLHPMDRIAWLTILRAPWCGLTLKDLHVLCGSDAKEYRNRPVLSLLQARAALLSDDGQRRVARVQPVLEEAVSGKHRQVSLSQWVERTWATLGGHACVDGAAYENLLAFFAMLEDLGWDTKALDERIAELCAPPDPHASEHCGVQLMSIHKAKGLGFDVVIVPGLERGTGSESRPLIRWIEQTRLVGEEEREEKEFVVSPIGRKGERSALYDWIGRQLNRREDEEAKRLIYVAATRAREELHLLGTATVKVAKDGSHEVGPGKKRSLLGIAWPALESDFARALVEETAAPKRIETALPEAASTIQLRRLPVDWKPSVVAAAVEVEETAPSERWERPQGSLALRALGTVVHGLLEDIAGLGGIADSEISQAAVQEVRGWRGRALAMLRSHGLPHKEAESQSTKVIDALVEVLNDPDGRWILGARADAETEVSWSSWADSEGGEIVKTLRGDRIFRAGATPRSDGNSHIWIVDYKTGRAGGKAIDKFLQQEKEKYRPQLDAYGEVMRKVHGDDIPLRLALYYPMLKRLVWW
jgi:ATP-dependent exoDNAse (exonuclease V) beta subunit